MEKNSLTQKKGKQMQRKQRRNKHPTDEVDKLTLSARQ